MSDNSQGYGIGQVIHILSNRSEAIVSGIVLEEIYYKRVDGSSVSYKIAIGPAGKGQQIVDLTKIDGEIFGSIEEVRGALLQRITAYVDSVCSKAEAKANAWYGTQQAQAAVFPANGDKLDPSVFLNNEPQQQQLYANSPQVYAPQQPQGTNLRARMADPDLLQRDLVMEDGSVQKVTINTNPRQ